MTLNQIKNIYCVGRNYLEHANELNNAVPTSPLIFIKPTHALAEAAGNEIILPADSGEVHHELEVVIHIARRYEAGIAVNDLVDKVALGIDFTLRDVQAQLKSKGYPWVLAKGFVNSAVLTPWQALNGDGTLLTQDFVLEKNNEEVQRGNIRDMIFDLPTLVTYFAEHLGLAEGDILFTGTPAGVGPVADGDHLALKWNDRLWGDFKVKLGARR